MDKRILSPVEVAQIALKKAMDASAELRSTANQFFYEQQSTGNVSLTGKLRRFVTRIPSSLLAASNNLLVTASSVIDEIRHRNEEQNNTVTLSNPLSLVRDFGITAGTVFVSAKVFEKLHSLSAVQEFKSAIKAVDLEKIQKSEFVGPLTSEFEAHNALLKSGIQFVREGNQSAFIFPEAIVSKMRQEFGEANAAPNNSKCFVLVFKECAQPRSATQAPRTNASQYGLVPNEPAHAYIPQ